MRHVATEAAVWSVCVLVASVNAAEAAELIEMPFAGRLMWAEGTMR